MRKMGKSKQQISAVLWRREKVQRMYSRGYGVNQISRELSIPSSTISDDVKYLNKIALDNQSPEELLKQMFKTETQIEDLLKIAWKTYEDMQQADNRDRWQAGQLIKQCNEFLVDCKATGIKARTLNKLLLMRNNKLTQQEEDTATAETVVVETEEEEEQ